VKELWLKYGKYARYLRIAAYPLFYLLCFAVFASLTFPYARLKERVVASFNGAQRASGGQQELQIDDMSGYWLSGVRMKGVRLFTASTEPGQLPQKIEIDEATVRYSILSGMFGGRDMSFDVMAFGGEAGGSFESHGKDQAVDLTLDGIDIGRIDPLVRLLGVPLQGKLGGKVKLTMPDGKATKGSGNVSFDVKDVVIGDGKAKFKGTLALPPINVGTVTLSGDAKDGVLKITKLVAGGKDLELQGEGRVTLRELATDSLVDAQLRFKINEAYRAKNELTKSLFGAPGTPGPALFELADARIARSKRADGFYAWTMRGPLGRADFAPAPNPGGAAPAVP